MIRELFEDHPGIWITAICVILFAFLIWAAVEDQRNFEVFAKQNHCRVTGKVAATTAIGTDYKGNMTTTYIPEKTIYTCDENQTIIR